MQNLFHKLSLPLFVIVSINLACAARSEVSEYLDTLGHQCLHHYFQHPNWADGTVSESFILNKDGSVTNIKILTHPKHYKTQQTSILSDKALVLAIKNAAPFSRPPESLHTPAKLILTISLPALDKSATTKVTIAKE